MESVNLSPTRVYVTEVFHRIVNETDIMGKVSKVAFSILDLGTYLVKGASSTFKAVGLVFKDFNDLTGAIGIIDRTAELLDPALREEAYKDWNTKLGKISKVSLIAGQFFSFISFVDKATYKSLTRAAWCIGKLPVIDLIKNAGFAVNSIVTIYTTAKKLRTEENPTARKTAMIKIAAEVSKLFMITIGTLLGIFAAYATAPISLTVTILGLGSNIIGLYDSLWKNIFSKTKSILLISDAKRPEPIFPRNAEPLIEL